MASRCAPSGQRSATATHDVAALEGRVVGREPLGPEQCVAERRATARGVELDAVGAAEVARRAGPGRRPGSDRGPPLARAGPGGSGVPGAGCALGSRVARAATSALRPRVVPGEARGTPRSRPGGWRSARSSVASTPASSAAPRRTGPKRDPEGLDQPGAQRGLVDEAGGAGVEVESAGVGGRPAAVGTFDGVGHEHVGVELGIAGARGPVHEGGGHQAAQPAMRRWPPSPRRAKRAWRSR